MTKGPSPLDRHLGLLSAAIPDYRRTAVAVLERWGTDLGRGV